jgi:DNA-binding CsgD family transcriptional regulator
MVRRLTTLSRGLDDLSGDDAGALSELTAAIYGAAVDPALWPAAMGAASTFLQSFSTVLLRWSSSTTARFVHDDGKLDPAFKSLYEQRYARIDRISGANGVAGLDQGYSVADVVDMETYRQTPFYREFAASRGLVDRLVVPVARTSGETLLFGVLRNDRDGSVDEAVRRRARLLVPHLRQSLRISGMVQSAASQAGSLWDVIDAMAAAVFLLDASARIVHTNQAADAALAERRAVLGHEGRLTTHDAATSAALAAAIADAPRAGGHSIVIVARDSAIFAGHVVPLQSARHSGDATVAVFVHPAGRPGAPEIAGQAFRLTKAEQRVLASVADGGSVAEVAARIGISTTTVKTHLQRIFAKTGTGRQTDLLRLVAGFAGPFRR